MHYRPAPSGAYLRVPMLDDGASGDGGAGDGIYGVRLPVAGIAGQRVAYYTAATAANAYASMSFLPELAERGPRSLMYTFGSNGLRITEWMYAGAGGEFIELTNLGAHAIDSSGWSIDDSNATAGAFPLGGLGVVQPGESVIITESTAASFRAAWTLPPGVKIAEQLGTIGGHNLGRNDQVHLFDASGTLQDRLDYGDQSYPGTIRTQNASGQVPCAAVGDNDVAAWRLAQAGDDHGSWASGTGDVGSPGSYVAVGDCPPPPLFGDGFE
jgi:hypothetical protein